MIDSGGSSLQNLGGGRNCPPIWRTRGEQVILATRTMLKLGAAQNISGAAQKFGGGARPPSCQDVEPQLVIFTAISGATSNEVTSTTLIK